MTEKETIKAAAGAKKDGVTKWQVLGMLVILADACMIYTSITAPMPDTFTTSAMSYAIGSVTLNAMAMASEPIGLLFKFNKQNLGQRSSTLSWFVYVSLFCACCLLCPRLHVGNYYTHNQIWAWLGTALTIAALIPIGMTLPGYKFKDRPPRLQYPLFLALLMNLAGLSIACQAWFPLLGLPGVVVALAWQTGREEKMRELAAVSEDGTAVAVTASLAPYKIVPYIY